MTRSCQMLRRGMLVAVVTAVLALLHASPASAHAELVASSPVNGAQLQQPPTEIRLTFTEGVNLLDGGLRLVDGDGRTVPTPEADVEGETVVWPMPPNLTRGSYLVNWRVVSSDGHPISGAFSFGVGAAAAAVAPSGALAQTAPWPVAAARLAGYLAFALFAGVVAFVLWCSPASRLDPTVQLIARVGLVGGVLATLAGILVQGPYAAGVGMDRLLDRTVLSETLVTPFGSAMIWRLACYSGMAAFAWRLSWLTDKLARWLVPALVVATAVTIGRTGHAAGGTLLDVGVDAAHALTAAIWVGGLATLVAVGRSVESRALTQFSSLAMVSVLTLVATGAFNALIQFDAVRQLWQTRYGLVLVTKLVLVGAALLAALVSRRRLKESRVPLRSVRVETGLTGVVLAVTSVLSLTSPPSSEDSTGGQVAAVERQSSTPVVQMPLGQGRRAVLRVMRPDTAQGRLRVFVLDRAGRIVPVTKVTLKVSLPARDLDAIPVPLTRRGADWVADYRFPLPGRWTATLTVEDATRTALVTTGTITVGD